MNEKDTKVNLAGLEASLREKAAEYFGVSDDGNIVISVMKDYEGTPQPQHAREFLNDYVNYLSIYNGKSRVEMKNAARRNIQSASPSGLEIWLNALDSLED